MSKFVTVLAMIIGSLIYQAFFKEAPNYMETAQMAYWISIAGFVFWLQEKRGES